MSRPEGPPNVQNTNICHALLRNGFPSSQRTKYLKSLFRYVAVTPITSQSRGHISTLAESPDPRYLKTHTYHQNFHYLSYITLDKNKNTPNYLIQNFTRCKFPVPCYSHKISFVLQCISQLVDVFTFTIETLFFMAGTTLCRADDIMLQSDRFVVFIPSSTIHFTCVLKSRSCRLRNQTA
jgi:hypothetical protein